MQAKTTILARWLFAAAGLLLSAPQAQAQDHPYPAGANVVNVKAAPYNAYGDGVHDDTQALQQAITDYVDTGRIVYLPNGTYLVSNRLLWPYSPRTGQSPRFFMVHGQSQAGAVIKLKDNCPGFQDPAAPLAMMRTTSGATQEQAFRNAVRDLTFDTGTGNPGAIGLQLFASNQGGAERVRIVSGDGQGVRGLDLGFDGGDGPAMFRDIYVRGFDYGVYGQYGYVMNLENVTVENQRVYGLESAGGRTALRHFTSHNTVSAINMVDRGGLNNLVLLDSDLTGTGAASTRPAIRDNGYLYARNVATSGYALAVDRTNNQASSCPNVPVGLVSEYLTGCTYDKLSASPDRSLGLPIRDIPEVPWGDPATEWANVVDYGADPTGNQDATAAVQAAVNSGKSTVYFPNGRRFRLDGTVGINGAVRHVLGNECNLFGTGGFKLVGGTAPVVVFEQFFEEFNNAVHLEQASTRTLVVNSVAGLRYDLNGTGDVFVNDVTTRYFFPNTAGASIWARQFNIEYATVENKGAKLWILGMKTESESTWLNTTLGGSTELLGCLVYSSGGQPTVPMFVNNESNVSLISVVELNFSGRNYDVWVRETRGGTTRELRRGQLAAGDVMAYSGFVATTPPPAPPLADGLYALTPECALATRLDVAGANTDLNTNNVQIWTDNNSNAQKWQLLRQPDGRYRLTSELNANRVLDVAGAGSAPGTNVHLWEWLDNAAQHWTLTPVANGYFTLTPQCAPGLRLDVAGANSAPGTNVAVWTDNGNAAQHWRFTPTTRNTAVTGTTAAAADAALALLPNPATGAVVLRAAAPLAGPVRLYNALGQLCRELPASGRAETTLPLAGLPAGLYSVVATDGAGRVLRRPLLVQ